MILSHGDTRTLNNLPWYTLELRSEKTIEGTLKRLGVALPAMFGSDAVEVFIPVERRDIDIMDLRTLNFVFVRSRNFQTLLRLKKITGVMGLLTMGDSNKPCDAISISDADAQFMIRENEDQFAQRALDIQPGDFVRLVDGEMRGYCGKVSVLGDGLATVMVELKTKRLMVETPTRNLLTLNVPENLRTFYYHPALADLPDIGIIREDIHYVEDTMYNTEDGLEAGQTTKFSRQQTVTAFVKRMIMTGQTNPEEIARQVMQQLEVRTIKRPKTLQTLRSMIRRVLLREYFSRVNPAINNYREGVLAFGPEYKFPLSVLAALNGKTQLPMAEEAA